MSLPVDDVLPELIAKLRSSPAAVLQAPTGAGKTTRVPPALLDAGLAGSSQIILLEPRRIAARAAARWIAAQRGVQLGSEVGYQVRFDRCAGPHTRILVVTPGILLQTLHTNPFLDRIGIVLFDEFHERGLENDLALGFVRLVQQTVRNDLKLVAMSATIATEAVAKYLGDCPVIASPGRMFPVTVRYEPKPPTQPWPLATAEAVKKLLPKTPGDVLVFLPGMYEIRQTARELERLVNTQELSVLPLHGDLPAAEQDAALKPQQNRKVVLATNVAETSVTVEGITAVVDTGLVRQMAFDPSVGLDRLSLCNTARDSAEQRAGRAGRTQPGACVRLWSEASHRGRAERTEPEIQRVDLSGALLHLLALGEVEPAKFPWFEQPAPAAITRAMEVLRILGAVYDGRVTELGRRLAKLPMQPRLGRMLLAGYTLGHGDRVALAAALLAERDPFRRASTNNRAPSESDLLDRVEVLEQFERDGRFNTSLGELDGGAARFVLRARDQLQRALENESDEHDVNISSDEAILRSVVAAFPDRVCRRRNPGGRKGVMVGGRGVRLDNRSFVTRPMLFVAVDVDAGNEETVVRIASGIELYWLPVELVVAKTEIEFDEHSGRVVARSRTRYLDLILEDTPTEVPDGKSVTHALADAARQQWGAIRPTSDSPAGLLCTRIRCLRCWRPQLNLPAFDEPEWHEILNVLVTSCRSIAEIRAADWLGLLRGRLTREQLLAVEREAPERLAVPSGSSVALQYEEGRPPVLAVRIQELFGLAETPRIAGGTVSVLLHLLAPNGRPQQVTADLASFWANTYPQVRKDLRARYPKHAWPEDPTTATPQSKPSRKK